MKCVAIGFWQVDRTLMTFSRSWVQRSRSQTICSKNVLFRWMYASRWIAVEALWFFVIDWLSDA